ncbi:MAG: hypothetical protein K5927_07055 [Lachnospiraceae bacterium]|nr:hypothetical protein [Lachnospiraceae bacterium]
MLSIREQIDYVNGLIAQAEKNLRSRIEGTLIVSKRIKSVQYYHQHYENGLRKRDYLKKTQDKTIRKLAQTEYDNAFLKDAKDLLGTLKILKTLNADRDEALLYDELSSSYDKLSPERKSLVIPYVLPRVEYTERWLSKEYANKGVSRDITSFMTENGENVRSKSEKIIADKLHSMGIPYRYEEELRLQGMYVHPDFTLLDPHKRKVYYYEHFGMMQDPEYCRNAIIRIAKYERAGYRLGREFFCTFESEENPLDIKMLETKFSFLKS